MCELLNIIFSEVGIALMALIVSIFTAISQMQHNKNSVRPILNIADCDYEDTLYVLLENKGVGPAIISDIKFVSSYYAHTVETNSLIELIPTTAVCVNDESEETANLNICFNTFVEDLSGRTIAQQESICLLKANFKEYDEYDKFVHLVLRNYLSNCSVSIEYKNIYDDKMDTYTHDFSFFGRMVEAPEDIQYSEEHIQL